MILAGSIPTRSAFTSAVLRSKSEPTKCVSAVVIELNVIYWFWQAQSYETSTERVPVSYECKFTLKWSESRLHSLDTIVVLWVRMLSSPAEVVDCYWMWHQILTGVCIRSVNVKNVSSTNTAVDTSDRKNLWKSCIQGAQRGQRRIPSEYLWNHAFMDVWSNAPKPTPTPEENRR